MPEIKKYLSKDGLEDYNELLSDSATLVQDGGITTVKLADGSVTNSKLANDVIEAIEISRAAGVLMGEPSESTWSRRTSAGSGMARVESVQGATVVWNQLVGSDTSSVTVPSGHKYLGIIGGTSAIATSDGTAMSVTGGTDQLFDLTQMFGAGNEPTTVAEFERMFPEAHYPYSEPTLKPVQIAGISSTDAQGNELDAIEWPTQTLRAAGSVRDELTSDELVTRVGNATVNSVAQDTGNSFSVYGDNVRFSVRFPNQKTVSADERTNAIFTQFVCSALPINNPTIGAWTACLYNDYALAVIPKAELSAQTIEGVNAWLQGHPINANYPLATPTTTPISPALPMSYKVEQGGTEAIIVPDGEISAAPVLTVAEGESAANLVMAALSCIAMPDGPIATTNHAINTYLTMNGKLYKVTTAIATGETIVAGTNVTQTTVMDELIARTA